MENIYNREEDYIIENNTYNITDLIYTHYYDDNELGGSSCYTELRIISDYDYVERKFNFSGKIIHSYRDYDDEFNIQMIEKTIKISNSIVEEVNKLNLENLKNNYYNKDIRGEYWVINYNKLFSIVGTYDNMPEEVNKLLEFVKFNELKEKCLKEVENLH